MMKHLQAQRAWFAFLGLMLLTGCMAKFVADYDPVVDETVTELHRDLETFFVELAPKIGTPEADHAAYVPFYQKIKVDASTIELRVAAQEKNELTLEQIQLLRQNIDLMEALHKTGIPSIEVLADIRQTMNIALRAILKFERAKQRGA